MKRIVATLVVAALSLTASTTATASSSGFASGATDCTSISSTATLDASTRTSHDVHNLMCLLEDVALNDDDRPWRQVMAAVCVFFAAMAGSYGPIVVNTQGDVYINSEPQMDCPPYDIEDPPSAFDRQG